MNSKTFALIVLALVVSLAGGCRSDGNWGRADTAQGWHFSTTCVADRADYNARRTWYLLSSAPGTFAKSLSDAPVELANTCSLYFEGHAAR